MRAQLPDPVGDDRRAVVRAGARLWMELRGTRPQLREVETLDSAVVQRGVRDALAAARRDREAVVLRGHEHAARAVVEHRMVGAAMPERELEGLVSGRQG